MFLEDILFPWQLGVCSETGQEELKVAVEARLQLLEKSGRKQTKGGMLMKYM